MSWYDLSKLICDFWNWLLNSKWFIEITLVLIIGLIILAVRHNKKTRFLILNDIVVFNVSLKVNSRNIDIAYMMYIQLRTRKIGIPFEENDIITEVYNSWYSAFKIIRELLQSIKPIPRNKELISIGISILNDGLRPHLTRWQGNFRKWYEKELVNDKNINLSPQEIQRKYPRYKELTEDIKSSQKEILVFLGELEKIFKLNP